VKISADVAAKIINLGVEEGDWVEKGDLLVGLDQERFTAALEQVEANHRSFKANEKLAKESCLKAEKDFARTKELVAKKLESQAIYDKDYSNLKIEEARYQSAGEQVKQASAAVRRAKDDLSKTTIYSPMSGTVSTLNKEVGEIALGSQFQEDVIMIISDLTEMEAQVNVDENDIVNVSLNDSATVEIDALPDVIFHGIVGEIASSANISGAGTTEQKTEFEVKVTVTNAVKELRPGMTASADITTETKEHALCTPIQCVTVRTPEQLKQKSAGDDSTSQSGYKADRDGFVTIVFLVENGLAKAVQVETGIQSETHIEILKGVTDGQEVVTGNYRAISQTLNNGSSVIVDNYKKKDK
jgi:HlyD family secretion protein